MGYQERENTDENYIIGQFSADEIDWVAKGAVTPVKN